MRTLPRSFLHCELEQSIKRTQKIVELEHQLTLFSRDHREMQSKISRLERQNSLLKERQQHEQSRDVRDTHQHIPKTQLRLNYGSKGDPTKVQSIKASQMSIKNAFLNASRYLNEYQKTQHLQSPAHHYSARLTPKSNHMHSTTNNMHSTTNNMHSISIQHNTPDMRNPQRTVQSHFYDNNAKSKQGSPILNKKQLLHTEIDKIEDGHINEDEPALMQMQLNRRSTNNISKRHKKYLKVVSKQVKEKGEDKG